VKTLLAVLFLVLPFRAFAQPAGVEACAACHGALGEGKAGKDAAPRLAGQPQPYLARQLDAYAEGKRVNPVMSAIAKQLAPERRARLAAYYAHLKAPATKPSSSAGASSAGGRGHTLATRGDESRRVQACENCHGPGGTGLGNNNPYLAGLDRSYLESALGEWKDGSRKTDPSEQMPSIGKKLSDSDIKALAAYYSSQQPPPPAASARKPAPGGGAGTK
jgi:cytochrome c553